MVYKRGEIYYTNFTFRGVRVNKSTGQRTKAAALQEEARMRMELEEKLKKRRGSTDEMLFSDAVERMYEETWSDQRSGKLPYERMLMVLDSEGPIKMEDVQLSHLDEVWLRELKKRLKTHGRSDSTVNRYMAHVSAILHCALNEWKVNVVLPSFKKIKTAEKSGRTRTFTKEEEESILLALRTAPQTETLRMKYKHFPEYAELLEVLLDTGMRLSEALSIGYSRHIRLDEREIQITKDIAKSGRPRTIPLTERAYRVLTLRRSKGDRPFPWDKNRIESAWQWVRRKLEMDDPEFVIHACRHTYATRLLKRGVDLMHVYKLLGHSNIKVTTKYLHEDTEDLHRSIKVLEA